MAAFLQFQSLAQSPFSHTCHPSAAIRVHPSKGLTPAISSSKTSIRGNFLGYSCMRLGNGNSFSKIQSRLLASANQADFNENRKASEYSFDEKTNTIAYHLKGSRTDYFRSDGTYFSLSMPDVNHQDTAALLLATINGLGAGGLIQAVDDDPLIMEIHQPFHQTLHQANNQTSAPSTASVTCSLLAPKGFRMTFGRSAGSLTIGTLMQVRQIIESNHTLSEVECSIEQLSNHSVTVSTEYYSGKDQKQEKITFKIEDLVGASFKVRSINHGVEVTVVPDQKDQPLSFSIDLASQQNAPRPTQKNKLFRPEYLKHVKKDAKAQQALITLQLLTPENRGNSMRLRGARAGAPRFLSPFGRDSILTNVVFLDQLLPSAVIDYCVLPHLSRILPKSKGVFPKGSGCHEVTQKIDGLKETFAFDYSMVDTAPLLLTLIAEVTKRPKYKKALLKALDRSGVGFLQKSQTALAQPVKQELALAEGPSDYKRQLLDLIIHVLKLALPFMKDSDQAQLLPKFLPGYEVGDWADSKNGNFGTRITLANAAIVNNAFEAIALFLSPEHHDLLGPVLIKELSKILHCDASVLNQQLKAGFQRYQDNYLDHFIIQIPRQEAIELTKDYCREWGVSPTPAIDSLQQEETLSLFSPGLTDSGDRPIVPNIHVAFALQDQALQEKHLIEILKLLQRPFPLGIHLPKVGLLVAIPLDQNIRSKLSTQDDYHINTIWPFMSYWTLLGLMRQAQRSDISLQLKQAIVSLVDQFSQEIKSLPNQYFLELFSVKYDVKGQSFLPKPFNQVLDGQGRRISCPIQLWSTWYPVVMDAVSKFLKSEQP